MNIKKIAKFLEKKEALQEIKHYFDYLHHYSINDFKFSQFNFSDSDVAKAFMDGVKQKDAVTGFEAMATKYDLFKYPIIKKEYANLVKVDDEAILKLFQIVYSGHGSDNPAKSLTYLRKNFNVKMPKNFAELKKTMEHFLQSDFDEEFQPKDVQDLCDYLHIKNEQVK